MYSDVLKSTVSTGATSVQNADGHWIDVAGTTRDIEIPCRYSVNNSGRQIQSEDGTATVYSYTVSMPQGYDDLSQGQPIRVYDQNDRLKWQGNVRLFHRGLMDAKAWV